MANKSQQATLGMFDSVAKFLSGNKSRPKSPSFDSAVSNLEQIVSEIKSLQTRKVEKVTSLAPSKSQNKRALASMLVPIQTSLAAVGNMTSNSDLSAFATKYSLVDLSHMTIDNLIAHANEVVEACAKNRTHLSTFPAAVAMVSAVPAVSQGMQKGSKQQFKKVAKSGNSAQVRLRIKAAHAILSYQVDPVIDSISAGNEDLANEYLKARKL